MTTPGLIPYEKGKQHSYKVPIKTLGRVGSTHVIMGFDSPELKAQWEELAGEPFRSSAQPELNWKGNFRLVTDATNTPAEKLAALFSARGRDTKSYTASEQAAYNARAPKKFVRNAPTSNPGVTG